MSSEQPNERWQVDTGDGQLLEGNFEDITAWATNGTIFSLDKVRKGNLRWIEAGKVPSLAPYFAQTDGAMPTFPPTVTVAIPAAMDTAAWPKPEDKAYCSVHPETAAFFICDTCRNNFCKTCPNSYGGNVKICPFCGAFCSRIEQVSAARTQQLQYRQDVASGFGFSDLIRSLSYPFKFKTSLIVGAIMFTIFSLGQGAMAFGGIAMLSSAIFCFLLANTLTFGILANTVDNFSKGTIGRDFMPSFEDFSIWDDVVHPFFLSIGVYLASFGPLAAVGLVAFFLVSSVASDVSPIGDDAARSIDPGLAYASKAVGQGEGVKKLLADQGSFQKKRVEDLERVGDSPETAKPDVDETEAMVAEADSLIRQQRKAQLEAAIGKAPETVAAERSQLITKILGYGSALLLAGGLCFLWGLFYFPAASIVAGYTRSFGATLSPAVGLDTIKRLGGDYFKILLMGLCLLVMSGVFGIAVAAVFAPFDLPSVGNLPAQALGYLFSFYLSVVFSCVVGFALYKAGDRLQLFR